MKENFGLFFYGLWSLVVQFIGVVVGIVGVVSLIETKLGWVGIILGIAIFVYGKAMRFNYQRESGYILHKGD